MAEGKGTDQSRRENLRSNDSNSEVTVFSSLFQKKLSHPSLTATHSIIVSSKEWRNVGRKNIEDLFNLNLDFGYLCIILVVP